MTEQETRLAELMNRDRNDRIGTAKQELLGDIAENGDPYGLADAFKDMSPFEKALGILYGKLFQAKGNAQVDNCFIWFETEFAGLMDNNPFTDFQKNMILTNAIQQLVGANPDGIRVLRKVLVTLNQTGK
jgi:hypothetical protein